MARRRSSWLLAATAVVSLLAFVPLAGGAPPSRGPSDGAWAEYALSASGGAPDGSFRQATEARLVLRLVDGAWTGSCTGTTTTTTSDGSTTTSFASDSPMAPPTMERGLHRGDQVDPALTSAAAEGCRHDLATMEVAGKADARTLLATEPAEASAYQDATLTWDARSGLVQSWAFAGRGGGFAGQLVDSSGL